MDISYPTRAVLAKVHVKEGERVKKGQLLAEVDQRALRAMLAIARAKSQARGPMESARAMAKMRQVQLENLRSIQPGGHARPAEVERAEADWAVASAQLQSAIEEQHIAELEVQRIGALIEEGQLRSPIEGAVARLDKQEAEMVGGTDGAAFITVVQLDPLRAVFHVPPGTARGLQPGRKANVAIAGETSPVQGTIETIAPVIDAKSGTVRVAITVANPRLALQSGARCTLASD